MNGFAKAMIYVQKNNKKWKMVFELEIFPCKKYRKFVGFYRFAGKHKITLPSVN